VQQHLSKWKKWQENNCWLSKNRGRKGGGSFIPWRGHEYREGWGIFISLEGKLSLHSELMILFNGRVNTADMELMVMNNIYQGNRISRDISYTAYDTVHITPNEDPDVMDSGPMEVPTYDSVETEMGSSGTLDDSIARRLHSIASGYNRLQRDSNHSPITSPVQCPGYSHLDHYC
jgi:hypothetical protein